MIVAGFGFRTGASTGSLRDALAATSETGIDALAVPADKAQASCFVDLADELALPVVPVFEDVMKAIKTTTQSGPSLDNRGTGSVAEACALAAAGSQAVLITTRHISPDHMATCAIAKGLRE